MLIDCHAHVYAFPKIRQDPAGTPFMSAEQQIAVMDAKGVDKAVILPLNNPEGPPERQSIGEVLWICERYPGRFIPFCNIDPRLRRRPDLIRTEEFEMLLEQHRDLGCKGLGEVTARVPFDDPSLWKLFEACEKIGFPVTFHTITPDTNNYGLLDDIGLPRFEKTLQRFPGLAFFGHSPGFWSEISGDLTPEQKSKRAEGPVKPGGRLKDLFRRYPRLYGDLSAGSGFHALTRDPEHAYEFIEEFQDRLLLGLDYCSPRNNMQHIEWLRAAHKDGHVSGEALEKIFWRNLNDVLHLGLEAHAARPSA